MAFEYKLHPLAELFPPMSAEEYLALKLSIKQNGVRQPILMHDDMVLDGRHRAKAVAELIEEDSWTHGDFPVSQLDPDDNPMDFVIDSNQLRRQLTGSQKAMVAARIKSSVYKPSTDPTVKDPDSTRARAERLGVGHVMVSYADKILDYNSAELIRMVDDGVLSLNAAYGQISKELKAREDAEKMADRASAEYEKADKHAESAHEKELKAKEAEDAGDTEKAEKLNKAAEKSRAAAEKAQEAAELAEEKAQQAEETAAQQAESNSEVLDMVSTGAAENLNQAKAEVDKKSALDEVDEIPDNLYSSAIIVPPLAQLTWDDLHDLSLENTLADSAVVFCIVPPTEVMYAIDYFYSLGVNFSTILSWNLMKTLAPIPNQPRNNMMAVVVGRTAGMEYNHIPEEFVHSFGEPADDSGLPKRQLENVWGEALPGNKVLMFVEGDYAGYETWTGKK